jgi:hypothetical protein
MAMNRDAGYIPSRLRPALYYAFSYRVSSDAKHDRHIARFSSYNPGHNIGTRPNQTGFDPNEFSCRIRQAAISFHLSNFEVQISVIEFLRL